MAVDGFAGADYVISQLGKSYGEMDCVHLAVVNVIKNCPGGDKSYRTAGCTELWNSLNKTGKYHHITECRTLAEAKRDGMLVGDLPVIYDPSTQKCEHIAYYLGGYKGYECIHSSASKGKVCETFLKNGFTHVLRHRDITGRPVNGAKSNATPQKNNEAIIMNYKFTATVNTPGGGALNLRSLPSTSPTSKVITKIPCGEKIGVIAYANDSWAETFYNGETGYVSRDYLIEDIGVSDPFNNSGVAGNGTWGVFVPCPSKDEASKLAEYFHTGFPYCADSID